MSFLLFEGALVLGIVSSKVSLFITSVASNVGRIFFELLLVVMVVLLLLVVFLV